MKYLGGFKGWARKRYANSVYVSTARETEFKECWEAAVRHTLNTASRVQRRDKWFIGGFLSSVYSSLATPKEK